MIAGSKRDVRTLSLRLYTTRAALSLCGVRLLVGPAQSTLRTRAAQQQGTSRYFHNDVWPMQPKCVLASMHAQHRSVVDGGRKKRETAQTLFESTFLVCFAVSTGLTTMLEKMLMNRRAAVHFAMVSDNQKQCQLLTEVRPVFIGVHRALFRNWFEGGGIRHQIKTSVAPPPRDRAERQENQEQSERGRRENKSRVFGRKAK